MTLQAIILGLDGVLAETHEARREAYNQVFEEAGLDWHWGRTVYAELLRGSGDDDLIRRFFASRLPRQWQTEDVAQLITVMKRRFCGVYRARLESGAVKLRSGVSTLLDTAARQGLRLALATNENGEHVARLLRATLGPCGAQMFAAVITAEAGRAEAATSTHIRALEELGLPAHACLVVESAPAAVGSAASAGIPTALIWGQYPQLQACGEALLAAGEIVPFSAPSRVLTGWDGPSPEEMLARLRHLHAAQTRDSAVPVIDLPQAWSLYEVELNDAGSRHFEN
jgi:beta-phosphoglucomutase-like phosphatase (HAD superfamily)